MAEDGKRGWKEQALVEVGQPRTVGPRQDEPAFEWEPYRPSRALRVRHTSCCGLYEFASESGTYFVLRRSGDDRYEETGRGRYRKALEAYIALVMRHGTEHLSRGEGSEPDTFLSP